jgi:hypothetical protein
MERVKRLFNNHIIQATILIVVGINIVVLSTYIVKYLMEDGKDQQNIYYFFSTSAQSIAAFIAFLISGFALVYQAMDNIESKDDTLAEVYHQIKIDYYKKIKKIAYITGLAIVFSLIIIWMNEYDFRYKYILVFIAIILIFITIFQGIWFVVYIIDPNKIRKAARELLNKEFKQTATDADEGTFMKVFIKLEKALRELFRNKELEYYITARNTRNNFLSFKQIAEALYRSEIIDKVFLTEVMELSTYRNLIAHGDFERVDQRMIERIEKAINKIEDIVNLR